MTIASMIPGVQGAVEYPGGTVLTLNLCIISSSLEPSIFHDSISFRRGSLTKSVGFTATIVPDCNPMCVYNYKYKWVIDQVSY